MRLAAFILITALLSASSLELAVAPAQIAPAYTPSCPRPSYDSAEALLAALPAAGYECAEQIAAALAPRADLAVADTLLALADTGPDTRARRNGLRALGHLAGSPRGSRAYELALRARRAALQATVGAILARERDNFLLQDAIWIVDSFFFPGHWAAGDLERIAADQAQAPALRERAARARSRLVYARSGPLAAADRAYILTGLISDSPGPRAAAADAIARLRSDQLDPDLREALAAALERAWAAEPPLALPAEQPDPRGTAWLRYNESSAGPLSARAAIARARDRLDGGAGHADRLRAEYEALALPHSIAEASVSIRAGPPADDLPTLLDQIRQARAAFLHAVGPALAAPIPGEGERTLSVLIFPGQAAYREYMRAFTPFSVDVDGIYDAASATLYTYRRSPAQSENSLSESLLHELAHHFAAGYIFPGEWQTPGYHAEPKGWADEGLAEVLAGLGADGKLAPRPRQLARLCARAAPPALGELLERRDGYDRFGRFDYDSAWALSYYLLEAHPEAARRLYAAFRDGSYRRSSWARSAGLGNEATFEAEWHAAIADWCASRYSLISRPS